MKYYEWSENPFCICKTGSLEKLTFKGNQTVATTLGEK